MCGDAVQSHNELDDKGAHTESAKNARGQAGQDRYPISSLFILQEGGHSTSSGTCKSKSDYNHYHLAGPEFWVLGMNRG